MNKLKERKLNREDPDKKKDFEAKQNAVGFFNLLLKIAMREKIDIGQFDNSQNINSQKK